uniref:Fibronectin type-II domain-containing protein n=1 Tax=Arcella intermedia TaxID=1963864 RepID=A0A6B2KXN4_9EUKA
MRSTCVFPFYFRNIKYEKCTTASILSKDTSVVPWCAISVDENLNVVEKGDCQCTRNRTNLILDQPAFFVYGSPDAYFANDGNKDDDFDTAAHFNFDNWYSDLSINIIPERIVFWGCPSCYKFVKHFMLHIYFTPDLTTPIWETSIYLNSTFRYYEIIVPSHITGHPNFLYVWTDSDVYLSEIEAFGDYVPKTSSSQLDCSLLLSRTSLGLGNSTWHATGNVPFPQLEDEVYVLHKSVVTLQGNFVNSFAFKITPQASDTFSFFIMSSKNTTNTSVPLVNWKSKFIEISLHPLHSKVSINGHNLDSSSIFNFSSSSSKYIFDDTKEHTCIIIYVIDDVTTSRAQSSVLYLNGKLQVFVDDMSVPLLSTSILLHQVLSFNEALTGFYVHSSDTSKRNVPDPGSLSLSWWKFETELFSDSNNIAVGNIDKAALIIGVIFGVVVLLFLIIALFFFLKKRNKSIERLPSEIIQHYRQYSRNPRPWNIIGVIDSAHAYTKKLKVGSSGYARMEALWMKMGGQDIEIEEAYAVHNPELLHSFATKHSIMTHNVRTNPTLFLSDNWKGKEDKLGTRKWTRETYNKLVTQFEWNQSLLVPIVPALHGTNEDVAENIVKSGFVALARLDKGYYGKGIYFTTSAEYGLPYYATKKIPTVIISMVISGNAFPVIEHPDSKNNIMGAAMTPGYHSHYVLTRKDGYPCPKVFSGEGDEQYFDEIVIEQENSILPFYFLKISPNNLGEKTMKLQKEIDTLRLAEFQEMKAGLNIRTHSDRNSSSSSDKIKMKRIKSETSSDEV